MYMHIYPVTLVIIAFSSLAVVASVGNPLLPDVGQLGQLQGPEVSEAGCLLIGHLCGIPQICGRNKGKLRQDRL